MKTRKMENRARFAAVAMLFASITGCSDVLTSPVIGLPDSIEVVESQVLMHSLGQTVELTARVKDRKGREISGAQVVWEVEHPTVATLESPNQLKSLANGETRVFVRLANPTPSVEPAGYNGGRLRREVSVRVEQQIASVEIQASATGIDLWAIGETWNLSAIARDAEGAPIASPYQVMWSSADPAFATVNSGGRLEAASPGQVAVLAQVEGFQTQVLVRISPAMSFHGCVSSGSMRFRDVASIRSRCDSDQAIIYQTREAAALGNSEGR